MIQLMTQPIPAAGTGERPVADACAPEAAHVPDGSRRDAGIAGFRTQGSGPEAKARTVTVQSFLAQFDTAQALDESAPQTGNVRPAPAEDPSADSAEAAPAAQQPGEPSPSGAESWLAGMLSQAGLVVQARDNPQAQTTAAVSGFASQSVDVRTQVQPTTAQVNGAAPLPGGVADDSAAKDAAPDGTATSAPAPREAAQSQAQTLLQQHLAAAVEAPDAQAAVAPPAPAVAPDPHLPVAGGTPQPANAAPAAPPLFDRPLHLKDNDAHWGEQMLTALRDNVELQLNQRVQNATIRLDPPELGAMEILVRHEAGQLNVQISASHGDVVRMLQQTSERLRQELVGQNFLQVDVQVSSDAQAGQGGQQNRQRFAQEQVAVAANPRDAQPGGRAAARGDSDVLITV